MKQQAINILINLIQNSIDNTQREKFQKVLVKIESLDEKSFNEVAKKTLGENFTADDLKEFFVDKAMQNKEEHEFIPINDTISYHIQDEKTLCLHLIPTKVSFRQLRESGVELAEALTQIREKMEKGEFDSVETVFAVSDILQIKMLQNNFRDLGFQVDEAPDFKKIGFDKPYAAGIKKEDFFSEEWIEKRDKFTEKLKAKSHNSEER